MNPRPMWITAAGWVGRGVKATPAAAGLAVLLAGVPWGLVRYIGWPLPREAPTWDEVAVFFD
jgi:hypothetical protein